MGKRFAVYKGLQKPLIYKGFKGKFIYWGLGSLLSGLVLGSLTMALVNTYIGVFVLAGIIGLGLMYTFSQQKKGLYYKSSPASQFILQARFNHKILHGKKKSI